MCIIVAKYGVLTCLSVWEHIVSQLNKKTLQIWSWDKMKVQFKDGCGLM